MSNAPPRTEFFRLNFSRAYLETHHFDGSIEYFYKDPRTNDPDHDGPHMAYHVDHHSGPLDDYSTGLLELGSAFVLPIAFPFIGLSEGVPLLINESIDKHVLWVVEIRNAGEGSSTLPLTLATKNIIYSVTARVRAETVAKTARGSHEASGGDLNWYRHDGRLDGSFNWEGPNKVGNRWDGLAVVFPGDAGVIYAVTPRVAPAASGSSTTLESGGHVGIGLTPPSGGDLLWYRHLGREDGTFAWQGPKRVGIRWDGFKHVFCGGDGIIYAIRDNGDLMWYRHVGYADGSFVWEGPKKVGIGWGELTEVFYGGNGIIYGVTRRVGAATHRTGGGAAPPSGGELLWYQHLGRADGSFNWTGPRVVGTRWDLLERVFSDGAGIIYGVTRKVDASFSADGTSLTSTSQHVHARFVPASGGLLLWYNHLGHEDGTFKWDGPKQVGTGWSGLEQLFCGGVVSS